eukprot:1343639-Pleurochrysis_carterae.AAC.5
MKQGGPGGGVAIGTVAAKNSEKRIYTSNNLSTVIESASVQFWVSRHTSLLRTAQDGVASASAAGFDTSPPPPGRKSKVTTEPERTVRYTEFLEERGGRSTPREGCCGYPDQPLLATSHLTEVVGEWGESNRVCDHSKWSHTDARDRLLPWHRTDGGWLARRGSSQSYFTYPILSERGECRRQTLTSRDKKTRYDQAQPGALSPTFKASDARSTKEGWSEILVTMRAVQHNPHPPPRTTVPQRRTSASPGPKWLR